MPATLKYAKSTGAPLKAPSDEHSNFFVFKRAAAANKTLCLKFAPLRTMMTTVFINLSKNSGGNANAA